MPSSLVKARQHPRELLALFVQNAGMLADAFKVEFQVWDTSASQPGTLLLPSGGGADSRVNVTTGAAHWATGCYAVHDPATSLPWAPAATYKRGVVVWYFTFASGEQEQIVTTEFEVFDTTVLRGPVQGLALVQDLRDGGLPSSVTDAVAHAALVRWRDMVERICRQRFWPVYETKRLRGNDGRTMFLSEPCWGLASYKLDVNTLDLAGLRVRGATGPERRNPCIELVAVTPTIYDTVTTSAFTADVDNLAAGVWGFLDDATLGPPREIRNAVIMGAGLSLDGGFMGGASGVIQSETTDGHSVSYATTVKAIRPDTLALLQHPAVREALELYRGPIAIGAP